jgi:hypothetical protein
MKVSVGLIYKSTDYFDLKFGSNLQNNLLCHRELVKEVYDNDLKMIVEIKENFVLTELSNKSPY